MKAMKFQRQHSKQKKCGLAVFVAITYVSIAVLAAVTSSDADAMLSADNSQIHVVEDTLANRATYRR